MLQPPLMRAPHSVTASRRAVWARWGPSAGAGSASPLPLGGETHSPVESSLGPQLPEGASFACGAPVVGWGLRGHASCRERGLPCPRCTPRPLPGAVCDVWPPSWWACRPRVDVRHAGPGSLAVWALSQPCSTLAALVGGGCFPGTPIWVCTAAPSSTTRLPSPAVGQRPFPLRLEPEPEGPPAVCLRGLGAPRAGRPGPGGSGPWDQPLSAAGQPRSASRP